LAPFFAPPLAVFLVARFALFLAAFFAGRREDFLVAGRRSSSAADPAAMEALEEGVAGVAAGLGAGTGAGSVGSGSIQPEPDQPISI
jgi:hypothetical protein